MEESLTSAEEKIGKGSYEMLYFFQTLVDSKKLKAYSAEVDKRFLDKDTDEEEIIRIKKGLTLTPAEKISEGRPYFLEDVESKKTYSLRIGSEGGAFYNDGDSQDIYHHTTLERLTDKFDKTKVQKNELVFHGLSIPQEMVDGILMASYTDKWDSVGDMDFIKEYNGNTFFKGEPDKLFDSVLEFLRN